MKKQRKGGIKMKQKHAEIDEVINEVSGNFIESLTNSLEEDEIDLDDNTEIGEYLEKWYKEDYRYTISHALRNYCKIISADLFEREGNIHYYVSYHLLDDEKEFNSCSF